MTENTALAVSERFLDIFYRNPGRRISLHQIPQIVVPEEDGFRVFDLETLSDAVVLLEKAFLEGLKKGALTEDHARAIQDSGKTVKERVALLRSELARRNPYLLNEVRIAKAMPPLDAPIFWDHEEGQPAVEAQYRAVLGLKLDLERQARFVGLWNRTIRQEEEVRTYGDRLVWSNVWYPNFETINRMSGWSILFMGLPGSGKSVLAASLFLLMSGRESHLAFIDGDMRRSREVILAPSRGRFLFELGGDKEGRDFSSEKRHREAEEFAHWVAHIANMKTQKNAVTIASCFPLNSQRKALYDALHDRLFVVWVKTPQSVCEERRADRILGPYSMDRRIRDGGIDAFEQPDQSSALPADLEIDTSTEPLYRSLERIVLGLQERGLVEPELLNDIIPSYPYYFDDSYFSE